MAIDYASLFADIGKMVKTLDQLRAAASGGGGSQPDLPALESELTAQLVASGRTDLLDGMHSRFTNFRSMMTSMADELASVAIARLTHRASVVLELPGSVDPNNTRDVLEELARQMLIDTESIQRSVVTAGSPVADASNAGDGTVVLTKLLDRTQAPTSAAVPMPFYDGLDSELAVPAELMTVTCTSDEGTGVSPGEERFVLEGQPAGQGDWDTEHSGTSVSFATANASGLISGGDFESFASDAPSGWTLQSGAAGAEILEHTLTPFRGSSSLELVGTGTDSDLRQASPSLIPGRRYVLALAYQGGIGLAGTLTFGFHSDSGEYTPASDQISLDAAALQAATGWTIATAEFVAPDVTVDDLQLRLFWSGGSGNLLIDSLALAPFAYGNGVGVAVLAGANQFVIGDRFTWTTTNAEGVMQRFFRRYLGVQMPSDVTPTRADSLAT